LRVSLDLTDDRDAGRAQIYYGRAHILDLE